MERWPHSLEVVGLNPTQVSIFSQVSAHFEVCGPELSPLVSVERASSVPHGLNIAFEGELTGVLFLYHCKAPN